MRVIVVDDSVIIRGGLTRLLEQEGHQVVGAFEDPERVASAVAGSGADAVVLDIRMPPTFTDEGIRLAHDLRAAPGGPAVLVLSAHAVPEYAARLLERGGKRVGYLLKDRIFQPAQLTNALLRLVAGGTVVDPELVGDLLTARRPDDPLADLTPRQLGVLRLMAEGLTDKGIAAELHVSLNTVGSHVRQIFQKLDLPETDLANRRVRAVLTYLRDR